MPSPAAIHILFEIHVGLGRRRSRARRRLRIGRALRRRFRLRTPHRHFRGLRRCLHLLSTMLSTPSDGCGTPSPTPCPICTSKMWGYCCGVNGRCALILTLCCRETPQQYLTCYRCTMKKFNKNSEMEFHNRRFHCNDHKATEHGGQRFEIWN